MKINSKLKEYEVIFEPNGSFFAELTTIPNAFWVIDQKVYQLYPDLLSKIPVGKFFVLEALENIKTIDTVLGICGKIAEMPAKRNVTLISVGGGIIQDITGFVANIMYRGIHWIFVPTTLLAACDSCIGGKTSLNYKKFKNLLGTFYPPDRVHIYSAMFCTLCDKDYKSGLGEVIKFNIMSGRYGLESIEKSISALKERQMIEVDEAIQSSLFYKKKFIEIDEFDCGERIKLNFAHTFGHAIEVVTEYKIPHGTAVAIGMIMANHISEERRLLTKDIILRSTNVLLKVIDIDINLLKKPISDYLTIIHKDKKQEGNSITAVLITKYDVQAELTVVHDIQEEEIRKAIVNFIEVYEAGK